LACGALFVFFSINAWSQGSEAPASGPAMAASAAAPASDSRQANRALRKKVYAAFAKDKAINAGDISVSVKGGAVTLSGSVADPAQIDKAAALAKAVPGVVSVKNKLTVQRGFGQ
jgi:osmotically-inducible protein OsmY